MATTFITSIYQRNGELSWASKQGTETNKQVWPFTLYRQSKKTKNIYRQNIGIK
jgi:hypothetical protein